MPRLPIPGSDDNTWGDILNDYLSVEHNSDGTQKTVSVGKGGTGATSHTNGNYLIGAGTGPITSITPAQAKTSLALTKADVGLSSVDDTSDATKNSASATLQNKVLDNTNALTVTDANLTLQDNSDTTKQAIFELSGISSSTTRTYTLPNGSGTLVNLATTQTLTNKRISSRVQTDTSTSTPTPTGDTTDIYTVTALAVAATFAAPTGTPTEGQKLTIRIKDDGTARALSWNAIYRAMGVALPATTVISKTMYLGFIYNFTDTRWDLVALSQEA